LPGRNLSEIPHPTVRETMERAQSWPHSVLQKVHLIHFNHTNPLLQEGSIAYKNLAAFGFQLSRVGDSIQL